MMELVLDFWPEHYQALYHAGMAEYAQGDSFRAKQRLDRFLELYRPNPPDNFVQSAKQVLGRISMNEPPEQGRGYGKH